MPLLWCFNCWLWKNWVWYKVHVILFYLVVQEFWQYLAQSLREDWNNSLCSGFLNVDLGWLRLLISCYHPQYSEPVIHLHSQRGCWDRVIWRYLHFPFCSESVSSRLLDWSPGMFQICLRKFVFCLSFEWYHITPSLSRLNI